MRGFIVGSLVGSMLRGVIGETSIRHEQDEREQPDVTAVIENDPAFRGRVNIYEASLGGVSLYGSVGTADDKERLRQASHG
jgi:hypothetical protein